MPGSSSKARRVIVLYEDILAVRSGLAVPLSDSSADSFISLYNADPSTKQHAQPAAAIIGTPVTKKYKLHSYYNEFIVNRFIKSNPRFLEAVEQIMFNTTPDTRLHFSVFKCPKFLTVHNLNDSRYHNKFVEVTLQEAISALCVIMRSSCALFRVPFGVDLTTPLLHNYKEIKGRLKMVEKESEPPRYGKNFYAPPDLLLPAFRLAHTVDLRYRTNFMPQILRENYLDAIVDAHHLTEEVARFYTYVELSRLDIELGDFTSKRDASAIQKDIGEANRVDKYQPRSKRISLLSLEYEPSDADEVLVKMNLKRGRAKGSINVHSSSLRGADEAGSPEQMSASAIRRVVQRHPDAPLLVCGVFEGSGGGDITEGPCVVADFLTYDFSAYNSTDEYTLILHYKFIPNEQTSASAAFNLLTDVSSHATLSARDHADDTSDCSSATDISEHVVLPARVSARQRKTEIRAVGATGPLKRVGASAGTISGPAIYGHNQLSDRSQYEESSSDNRNSYDTPTSTNAPSDTEKRGRALSDRTISSMANERRSRFANRVRQDRTRRLAIVSRKRESIPAIFSSLASCTDGYCNIDTLVQESTSSSRSARQSARMKKATGIPSTDSMFSMSILRPYSTHQADPMLQYSFDVCIYNGTPFEMFASLAEMHSSALGVWMSTGDAAGALVAGALADVDDAKKVDLSDNFQVVLSETLTFDEEDDTTVDLLTIQSKMSEAFSESFSSLVANFEHCRAAFKSSKGAALLTNPQFIPLLLRHVAKRGSAPSLAFLLEAAMARRLVLATAFTALTCISDNITLLLYGRDCIEGLSALQPDHGERLVFPAKQIFAAKDDYHSVPLAYSAWGLSQTFMVPYLFAQRELCPNAGMLSPEHRAQVNHGFFERCDCETVLFEPNDAYKRIVDNWSWVFYDDSRGADAFSVGDGDSRAAAMRKGAEASAFLLSMAGAPPAGEAGETGDDGAEEPGGGVPPSQAPSLPFGEDYADAAASSSVEQAPVVRFSLSDYNTPAAFHEIYFNMASFSEYSNVVKGRVPNSKKVSIHGEIRRLLSDVDLNIVTPQEDGDPNDESSVPQSTHTEPGELYNTDNLCPRMALYNESMHNMHSLVTAGVRLANLFRRSFWSVPESEFSCDLTVSVSIADFRSKMVGLGYILLQGDEPIGGVGAFGDACDDAGGGAGGGDVSSMRYYSTAIFDNMMPSLVLPFLSVPSPRSPTQDRDRDPYGRHEEPSVAISLAIPSQILNIVCKRDTPEVDAALEASVASMRAFALQAQAVDVMQTGLDTGILALLADLDVGRHHLAPGLFHDAGFGYYFLRGIMDLAPFKDSSLLVRFDVPPKKLASYLNYFSQMIPVTAKHLLADGNVILNVATCLSPMLLQVRKLASALRVSYESHLTPLGLVSYLVQRTFEAMEPLLRRLMSFDPTVPLSDADLEAEHPPAGAPADAQAGAGLGGLGSGGSGGGAAPDQQVYEDSTPMPPDSSSVNAKADGASGVPGVSGAPPLFGEPQTPADAAGPGIPTSEVVISLAPQESVKCVSSFAPTEADIAALEQEKALIASLCTEYRAGGSFLSLADDDSEWSDLVEFALARYDDLVQIFEDSVFEIPDAVLHHITDDAPLPEAVVQPLRRACMGLVDSTAVISRCLLGPEDMLASVASISEGSKLLRACTRAPDRCPNSPSDLDAKRDDADISDSVVSRPDGVAPCSDALLAAYNDINTISFDEFVQLLSACKPSFIGNGDFLDISRIPRDGLCQLARLRGLRIALGLKLGRIGPDDPIAECSKHYGFESVKDTLDCYAALFGVPHEEAERLLSLYPSYLGSCRGAPEPGSPPPDSVLHAFNYAIDASLSERVLSSMLALNKKILAPLFRRYTLLEQNGSLPLVDIFSRKLRSTTPYRLVLRNTVRNDILRTEEEAPPNPSFEDANYPQDLVSFWYSDLPRILETPADRVESLLNPLWSLEARGLKVLTEETPVDLERVFVGSSLLNREFRTVAAQDEKLSAICAARRRGAPGAPGEAFAGVSSTAEYIEVECECNNFHAMMLPNSAVTHVSVSSYLSGVYTLPPTYVPHENGRDMYREYVFKKVVACGVFETALMIRDQLESLVGVSRSRPAKSKTDVSQGLVRVVWAYTCMLLDDRPASHIQAQVTSDLWALRGLLASSDAARAKPPQESEFDESDPYAPPPAEHASEPAPKARGPGKAEHSSALASAATSTSESESSGHEIAVHLTDAESNHDSESTSDSQVRERADKMGLGSIEQALLPLPDSASDLKASADARDGLEARMPLSGPPEAGLAGLAALPELVINQDPNRILFSGFHDNPIVLRAKKTIDTPRVPRAQAIKAALDDWANNEERSFISKVADIRELVDKVWDERRILNPLLYGDPEDYSFYTPTGLLLFFEDDGFRTNLADERAILSYLVGQEARRAGAQPAQAAPSAVTRDVGVQLAAHQQELEALAAKNTRARIEALRRLEVLRCEDMQAETQELFNTYVVASWGKTIYPDKKVLAGQRISYDMQAMGGFDTFGRVDRCKFEFSELIEDMIRTNHIETGPAWEHDGFDLKYICDGI